MPTPCQSPKERDEGSGGRGRRGQALTVEARLSRGIWTNLQGSRNLDAHESTHLAHGLG